MCKWTGKSQENTRVMSVLPTLATFSREETATGAGCPVSFFANVKPTIRSLNDGLSEKEAEAFDVLVATYQIDLEDSIGFVSARLRSPWDLTQQIVRNLARAPDLVPRQSDTMLIPVLCTWVPRAPFQGRMYCMWRIVMGSKRAAMAMGIDKYLRHWASIEDDHPTPEEIDGILDIDAEVLLPAPARTGGLFPPMTREQYSRFHVDTGDEAIKHLDMSKRTQWKAELEKVLVLSEQKIDVATSWGLLVQALIHILAGHDSDTDTEVIIPILDPSYSPTSVYPSFHPSFVPPVRWKVGSVPIDVVLASGKSILDVLRKLNECTA